MWSRCPPIVCILAIIRWKLIICVKFAIRSVSLLFPKRDPLYASLGDMVWVWSAQLIVCTAHLLLLFRAIFFSREIWNSDASCVTEPSEWKHEGHTDSCYCYFGDMMAVRITLQGLDPYGPISDYILTLNCSAQGQCPYVRCLGVKPAVLSLRLSFINRDLGWKWFEVKYMK